VRVRDLTCRIASPQCGHDLLLSRSQPKRVWSGHGSNLALWILGNAGLKKNEQCNSAQRRNLVCSSTVKLIVSTSLVMV
jgi:hypothetical protein